MTRIRSYGWMAALAVVGLLACVGEGGQPLAPMQGGSNIQAKASSAVPFADLASPLAGALGKGPPAPPPPLFSCKGGKDQSTGAKVIGPAGGTVAFGPHSLIVPAGALSVPTAITAATLHGDTLAVTFGPSGLHFNQPATLVLSYKHCNVTPTDTLNIVLVNNQMTELLQMVPSKDKKLKQAVEGLIEHFSVYAASESRSASGVRKSR
jgi:hypothetical protein